MGLFEAREAKARRLAQRESNMVEALEKDDAATALALSREGVGLGPVRGLGWSSFMPSEPPLLLAIRWGSASCFTALLAEAGRLGLVDELANPELMRTAMLAGQASMAKALREAGGAAPTLEQLGWVLEQARNSDGRAVKNKHGAKEIRRMEALGGQRGLLWRDLLDPVVEWAAQELGPAALAGEAGGRLLGAAGSGRRAKALLSAGADPNQPDSERVWPLDRAIKAGRKDWIAALIEGGADPSSLGRSGDMGEAAARANRPKALEWGQEALRQTVASAVASSGPGEEGKSPSGPSRRL